MRLKEFGTLLFNLRINKGLSLKEASREMGVDKILLDRFERGYLKSFPRNKTLVNIADFYNIDFQYIPEQLLVVVSPQISLDTVLTRQIEDSKEKKDDTEEDVMTIEEGERVLIRRALIASRGNRKKASDMLGIGERTLYRKITEYEIIY